MMTRIILGKVVSAVDGYCARFEKRRRIRTIGLAPWKPLPPITDDPDWDVETFDDQAIRMAMSALPDDGGELDGVDAGEPMPLEARDAHAEGPEPAP